MIKPRAKRIYGVTSVYDDMLKQKVKTDPSYAEYKDNISIKFKKSHIYSKEHTIKFNFKT